MLFRKRHNTFGHAHWLAIVLTLVSVVLAAWLLVNRQYVVDQVTVWQYQPSDEVAALAQRSSMSEQAKFYFYASQPTLEDAANFNQKCTRKEQNVAILGCYTGRFIYIYNVTDEKLDGIREVTAAHEMLHAAYSRLSADEKSRLATLLTDEYDKLKSDERFAEKMAFYARTEPGERDNELHSIIGTEVDSISGELEAHYRRYFIDRGQIVALHHKYEDVFNDLKSQADDLIARMTKLGDDIEADTATYNTQVTQLNQDIEAFNARANGGGFESEAEFNRARGVLVARAGQLEVMRQEINQMVARYEALRHDLEEIASQSSTLNRSLDGTLAPSPSI